MLGVIQGPGDTAVKEEKQDPTPVHLPSEERR
jgi:hypothetical protein